MRSFCRTLLCFTALLLTPSLATHAAEPVPIQPVAPEKRKEEKRSVSEGPLVETQARSRGPLDENKTEQSLRESIENQEQILQLENRNTPSYAKHAMALADFYWDLAELYGNLVHSEAIEKPLYEAEEAGDEELVGHWQREQQRLRDLQRNFREETIKRYKDLTRRFKNAANIDEIRYFLGYNLTEIGRGDEGVTEYEALVRNNPNSPYVPDALVNIGDYYFENDDFYSAHLLFERVQTYTDSPVYGYALYKDAWSLYNLQEYESSLQRFVDVIQFSKAQMLEGKEGGIALRRESQNELILPYAEIGESTKILDFLVKKADAADRQLEIAANLAGLYTEQSQWEKSNELLRLLIKTAQQGAIQGQDKSYLTVQFQRQIVENAIAANNRPLVVAEIDKLIPIFKSDLRKGPESYQKDEATEVRIVLAQRAFEYHTEYNKTKEERTLDDTQRIYRALVELFPEDENSEQLAFNRALLLMNIEKWEEAAAEFERILERFPNGQYASDSGEQIVLAYLAILKQRADRDDTQIKSEAEDDLKPMELPPEERRFVTAIDRWLAQTQGRKLEAEDIENLPIARFAAAKIYYNYNHFPQAAERFVAFIENHPDDPDIDDARRLVLSAYNLSGDVDNLRKWANIFDKLERPSAELATDVREVRNAFNFQECQKTYGEERYIEAADCFEKYAAEFPNESRAIDAIYNAALAYFNAKEVVKALETESLIIKNYPKHERAPSAANTIGDMYRQMAAYEEAATWYEFTVQRYPNHRLAKNALRSAAIFRKTLGQYAQAIKNLKLYMSKYPNEPEIPRVDYDIILILETEKKWTQVVRAADAHLRKFKEEPASVRLQVLNTRGKALLADRKNRDATQAFRDTVETFNQLPQEVLQDLDIPGYSAAAESHFHLGEVEFAKARAITLTGRSEKAVSEAVTQKLTTLNNVKSIYQEVIAYEHPGWVIAASAQLGLAFKDTMDAIEQVEPPARLRRNPEAEAVFRDEMSALATPFREEAIFHLRRALQVSQESRWFNEYTEKAEAAIAQIDLEDRSVKEFRLRPIQVSPNTGIPDFLGNLERSEGDFKQALAIVLDKARLASDSAQAERLFRSAGSAAGQAGAEAFYNLGILQSYLGKDEAARGAFEQALSKVPDFAPAKARLLAARLRDGQPFKSIEPELDKLVAQDRFQADAHNIIAAHHISLAQEALARGDQKGAAAALHEARRHGRNVLAGDPHHIGSYLNIGYTYYLEGLYDQAGLVADDALEKHPDAAQMLNLRGLVYLSHDNLQRATSYFQRALKADPRYDDARLNLAAIELGYASFDTALARFNDSLKARPGDPEILLSRGVTQRGREKFDEAEKDYLAALQARPNWEAPNYNLCVLHQQFTLDYPKAKTFCENFLKTADKKDSKYDEVTKRLNTTNVMLRFQEQKNAPNEE